METHPNDPINVVEETDITVSIMSGLTKREYFSAMALQGILSNSELLRNYKEIDLEKLAVKSADNLINQLNEEEYDKK